MRISVVIVTLNRAKYLKKTLESFSNQTFKDFEVIVVNGPSIDNTEEICNKLGVRYFHTNKANICVSRNIGIKNSNGDIIFFIDDDAIPKEDCLLQLARFYKNNLNPSIGAIGGTVYNEDGSIMQFKNGYIGIWGEVNMISNKDQNFNNSNGYYFNTTIGVNSAYPKKALLDIGGFDEEIEYQYDESDLCIRLIKANYKVVYLNDMIVYHKYAPSPIRNEKKIFTNWNKIVKNSIYFSIKNSNNYAPLILRLIKPITLHWDKFKKNRNQQTGILRAIKSNLILFYWMLKGYFKGFLGRRKLMSK